MSETNYTTEVEILIRATVHPGDPGVHTFANGDPGYPPTGPEADDFKIYAVDEDGNEHEIPDELVKALFPAEAIDWNHVEERIIDRWETEQG